MGGGCNICAVIRLHSDWGKAQLIATCLVVLQLEQIDTSPKNDRDSEGDEEEVAKEGRDNSDEEKHQVELKKTQ
jgi:hypothetical protein